MILILSKKSLEISTEQIMDWLYSERCSFKRINGDDIIDSDTFCLKINDNKESLSSKLEIDVEFISVVWFRRWSDRQFLDKYLPNEGSVSSIPYLIVENINFDRSAIRNFLLFLFRNKPVISNPLIFSRLNKFIVLIVANEVGLKVPETIVCNKKSELIKFFNKHKRIITKDIENSVFTKVGSFHYSFYTAAIEKSVLDALPNNFSLSAFQEEIQKKYEIRVFYFFGKIYSMAIFSQNDSQTKTDFRIYNISKPNRNVPYSLPISVASKVKHLMKKLGLETGSIDLIKSINDEYIFLEVNPVGQFGMVSKPCNYNLEYIIAKKLISYERAKKI